MTVSGVLVAKMTSASNEATFQHAPNENLKKAIIRLKKDISLEYLTGSQCTIMPPSVVWNQLRFLVFPR